MLNTPAITVLMPAYNADKYISEAIRSVLTQTFTDFELLIINDGSTDDTAQIVRSFDDERIVLVSQENEGVSGALNTGLGYARAQYIARFDADDICHPKRLEKQYSFLIHNPDHILVGSDVDYIMENGLPLFHSRCIAHKHDDIMNKLYFYCPFFHPAVMYRKQVVLAAGSYSTDAHNFEDYLLWTAISNAGKFHNLDEPLIAHRLNPSSVTIDERWRGKRFRDMKRAIIIRGSVTPVEGQELLNIIKKQDTNAIKQGAYHALCGKKLLADNHQPKQARAHIIKAIAINPARADNYALYLLSYLPAKFIGWLHSLSPNKL